MAFQKWNKLAESTCYGVKVNTILENSSLKEGDDIAELIVLLKQGNYSNSPLGILDKLTARNNYLIP